MSCSRFSLITIFIFTSLIILPACEPIPARSETDQTGGVDQLYSQFINSPVSPNLFETNPLITVNTTSINDFLPLVPAEAQHGTCLSRSRAINNAYAWRCQSNNQVFDPCLLAADGQTIVCGADPFNQEGFKVNLIHPLPQPERFSPGTRPQLPWLLELANDVVCRLTKKAIHVEGQQVNYVCSDQSRILGEPRPGRVWMAKRAVLEETLNGWKVQEISWTDIFAVWQTVDPGRLIEEIGLGPHQVRMQVKGLAHSLQGRVVPAASPNLENPSILSGVPAHLRFSFDHEVLAPWVNPSFDRQLLIYPVDEYRQIFRDAGISEIDQQIKTLDVLLRERPQAPQTPLPMLPPPGEAIHDLATQVQYLQFDKGSGVRFIARYTQEARPFSNEDLFYTFQGLTADGRYYVALFYPIATPVLPDKVDMLDPEEVEKLMADYPAYRQQIEAQLSQLNPADFTPDLAALDKMVESLQIEPEKDKK